jgi:KDO2-lipid IV(A) lauroyltransferase
MFMEMIKTMSISSRNEQKICNHKYRVDKEYEKKKSIMLLASHYASWEWLITLNQGYHGVGVYKNISNKYFDKLIRDIRSKYNTELVHQKSKQRTRLSIYGLPSDQSQRQIGFSLEFLGIEVPIPAEMLAKDMT